VAAAVAAVVWAHGLAALLRHLGPDGAPLGALPLTVAAVAVAAVAALVRPARAAVVAAAGTGLAAAVVLQVAWPGAGVAALALPLVAVPVAWGAHRLAARLPASIDGLRRRRPLLVAGWALLALVAVVQTGRLATHVTDPSSEWFLTTTNPFWADHECLNAYVYAGELSARGEPNVYDAAHYPALDAEAAPETSMEGMVVEDPFQYPPQFLLLPRLAVALTGDYGTIRAVWFAFQATLFAAVAFALAAWIGGATGRRLAWLFPAALSAFPALHALQYGQFHLAAVALAVAALLAFERRRPALGGTLLAVAVLAKIFPGVLLVPLVVRRRWRDLAWTGGAAVAITLVALAVVGTAPFAAFLDYQVPRLGSSLAFGFDLAWPEIHALLVADNQGVRGVVLKLGAMGVPGMGESAARAVSLAFGLVVIGLAALFGHRARRIGRWGRAAGWLALLGLASLASGGAWGDYVPLVATWLLPLLAARGGWSRAEAGLLGVCWLFQYTLLGTSPLGDWGPAAVMIPLSLVASLLLFGLFFGTLGRSIREGEGAAVRSGVRGAGLAPEGAVGSRVP
jgi:hypothetical protein